MKVALVVGHKEDSPGACNKTYNICEYEFNKKLTHAVAKVLNILKVNTEIIFRTVSYSELPNLVNSLNPDMVVSFHCNAYNTKSTGSEVLYYYKSTKSEAIAKILQKYIVGSLRLADRGIKPTRVEDRGGYLLRYTNAPCVIIEPFFIDNDADYFTVESNYMELIFSLAIGVQEALSTVK